MHPLTAEVFVMEAVMNVTLRPWPLYCRVGHHCSSGLQCPLRTYGQAQIPVCLVVFCPFVYVRASEDKEIECIKSLNNITTLQVCRQSAVMETSPEAIASSSNLSTAHLVSGGDTLYPTPQHLRL